MSATTVRILTDEELDCVIAIARFDNARDWFYRARCIQLAEWATLWKAHKILSGDAVAFAYLREYMNA